jgi:hypothetical protein
MLIHAPTLMRAPPNPSASALERVLACTASHVLPAIYDAGGEHAQRGTAIGRFVRSVIGGTPVDMALNAVPVDEWRETCRHLNWQGLVGDLNSVRGEMAYALDVETDEVFELGSNIGRAYPSVGPTTFVGSDDIEGVRLDDVPVVGDIKSGHAEVTACEDNAQIRFFCRVKQLQTGAPRVEGRILYVREDGHVRQDCHEFGAFDLESFQDDLRTMARRISDARARLAAGDSLSVYSGDHCTYCPAMQACPRYTALARNLVPELLYIKARFAAMTPDQQGSAWLVYGDAKALLEEIGSALKAIAKQAPIPLPDGKVVKEIEFDRSDFSREKALQQLEARGATAADIAGLYVEHRVHQVRVVGRKSKPTKKGKAA